MDNTTTNTNTTKRKRQYYIGAAIVAVVLLVILILLLVFLLPSNRCKLVETEPSLTELLKEKKNYASANNTALANMIGYLNFSNRGYLPLVLSKFVVDNNKVTLASECATLTWNYEVKYLDPRSPEIALRELTLDVPTEEVISDSNGSRHTCLLNVMYYGYGPEHRFSCKTKMIGKCHPETATKQVETSLVEIVMGSLELELFGNSTKIIKGEFSATEADGSCSVFQI